MRKTLMLLCLPLLFLSASVQADIAADKAAGTQALAESRFSDARDIYAGIVESQPEDGEAHYRLGTALMGLEELDAAVKHFTQAGELGFQPTGVGYRLARIHARQGDREAALAQLESIAEQGFPAPALIENQPDFDSIRDDQRYLAALEAVRANRYPCESGDKHREFDFWAGEWDVTSLGQPAGFNDIQVILGGCVVFENWASVSGISGKSFNYYDRGEKHWRQIWVDETGNVIEFTGQVREGVMYYTAQTRDPSSGEVTHHKMTFFPNDDGSVRQLMEASSDEGKTWTVSFDGLYVRKAEKLAGN